MVTGDPRVNRETFHFLVELTIMMRELLVRVELEKRSICYETLPYIFPALGMPPPIVPPPP